MCKCINSSIDDPNISTILQNMIMSEKVSKNFDLKHTDAIESVPEIDNLKKKLVID